MNQKLYEKLKEALVAVMPITLIMMILSFTLISTPPSIIGLFLTGAVLLILGMGLFTLGADIAMMPIGEEVGKTITKSKRVGVIVAVCFVIGIFITVAEPDLQVLAAQTPAVPTNVLILTVAVGVGGFLMIAFLRILLNLNLRWLLIIFYAVVFILAAFSPAEFLPVAFDSGGVTTGPITVPFIMALGLGLTAVRGDSQAEEDSFGLVGLCSIGPILAVLLLSLLYDTGDSGYSPTEIPQINGFGDIIHEFVSALPHYAYEILVALSPIIVFFIIFQIFFFKMSKNHLLNIISGILYTYVGLLLFLTGVNVGFMPAGSFIGMALAGLSYNWILIPLGMLIGFVIVKAEPAVAVLNKQVEDITGGAISRSMMMWGLSVGMAVSVGLAMLRVLTGIHIMYFLLPGYVGALLFSFFVPQIFTAIAFDSGGVASGPMTATFLLPFAMGVCDAVGGNVMTDAFGIVAMVAMTPLITIQIIGLIYKIKTRFIDEVYEIDEDSIIDYDEDLQRNGDDDIILEYK